MGHAKFSASSKHRWARCPGSIKAEESFPDTTTKYSAEGTVAHGVLEWCLRNNHWDCSAFPKRVVTEGEYEIEVSDEMQTAVNTALSYIKMWTPNDGGSEVHTEMLLDYPGFADVYGTADVVIHEPEANKVHVIDFKYGQGVQVYPEGNDQLEMYGIMALKHLRPAVEDMLSIEERDKAEMQLRLSIIQPRGGSGSWRSCVLNTEEQLTSEHGLINAINLVEDKSNYRIAGEVQCRWCKAKGECDSFAAWDELQKRVALPGEQGDFVLPSNPAELTQDQVIALLDNMSNIESWLADFKSYTREYLLKGNDIPGYKVVDGRSLLKWDNPEVAESAIKLPVAQKYNTKRTLATPTQMLTRSKKNPKVQKYVDKLASRKPGNPAVVPESDPRKVSSNRVSFINLDSKENV